MNKLVESIIKPLLEDTKITKIIGVYGGRFQPFGPHHYKTYKWLTKYVDEAYITTSNIKKPPRHPMNFKEKVRHMSKMGVPSNRIVQEKSPYVAKNLMKKFNEKTTAVVYVFGAKDAGRLGGSGKYFKDYKKNKKDLRGHEEHGYYLTAPHISISIGGKEVSGTTMRELLGSDKFDDNQRAKLFKKMFGYFNQGVYNMMTNKFSKLFKENTKIIPWKFSNQKPSDPRNNDGKGKELLQDLEIDLEIGDTIKMGRFKNKKVVVKSIDWNEKGDLLINGRPALKFRIIKKGVSEKIDYKKALKKLKIPMKLTTNKQKLVNYLSTNPQVLTQLLRLVGEDVNKDLDEFIMTVDLKKIIKEVSSTANALDANDENDLQGLQAVDSGPSAFMGGMNGYAGRNKIAANKIGWEVMNYILNVDADNVPPLEDEILDMGWPMGPHKSVSYFPAGIGTGTTANNQENLAGNEAYNKWLNSMNSVATEVGMELYNFMDDKQKALKKQVRKDSKATIKQQKKEEDNHPSIETMGETLTKNWWKENLIENIVTKNTLKPRGKELLLMGGAYGHMAHPFDDKDLTFGDLKNIITNGLGGQLNREDNVTEKLDGQNIMVSWKDGKLIAARNKGHIKNGGATALTKSGIKSKFQGRGDIADAFNFAMNDLEKAISGLSQKQKDKIFNNGYNFMNMEVMWPKSANVIDYDVATLVFHGALKYDDSGTVIGEVPGSGRMLGGMIQQINQHIQKKYSIGKPNFLKVPKHQDFGKMKGKFLSRLTKLKNKFGLKDKDTLALYHQKWWEQFILKQLKKIPKKSLKGLVKRWAFFDKSYTIPMIKKDLKEHDIFLQFVLDFDKKNHAAQVKENMKPFETLFFEVGAEILKNVQGFIAANPNKAVQGINKRLDKAISNVQKGGDLKKLNTLKLQLDKLNKIGGTKAIVPSEGIVFKYKGKTYKFTGAFAPVNQITGLISF